MMKSIQYCGTLLLFFFIFSACSSDQKQEEQILFARYDIRYLQQERHLRAQVSFSLGDSLTRVAKDFSTVRVEGKPMERRNLKTNGIRYQYEKNQDYQTPLKFRMIEKDNREIFFTAEMAPIDSFYIDGPIEKSKNLQFSWVGAPLKANEQLVLLFTDQQNKATSQTLNGPTDQSTSTIPTKYLSELSPGKGQLYLVKKQWINQRKDQVQSESLVEYYTKSIDIEVK